MIHLVVTSVVKEGSFPEFLRLARELAGKVRRESGCVGYEFTVDVQSSIPVQEPVQANRVTLIEQWESLDALRAHLETPHMREAGPRMSTLRESVSIRVTRPI